MFNLADSVRPPSVSILFVSSTIRANIETVKSTHTTHGRFQFVHCVNTNAIMLTKLCFITFVQQTDGWSASPDDLLDSFLSINGDFLKELDDSQNIQFNAISEANAASSSSSTSSSPPTVSSGDKNNILGHALADVNDFQSYTNSSSNINNVENGAQIDLSEYVNFGGSDEPNMSSSSSDSGLSSDNMEM